MNAEASWLTAGVRQRRAEFEIDCAGSL